MSILARIPLRAKLFILVSVSALGLIIFGASSYMLRQSEDMTASLRVYDDVNADAVLPDLNVVQAHVPASEMLMVKDREKIKELAARIRTEEQAYDAAEKDVLSRLPAGKTSQLIQGMTHQLAMQYYAVVDRQFVPAMLKGDGKAAQRLLPDLMNRYEASQVAPAEMVQADTDEGKAARDRASAEMGRRTVMLLLLGVALVAVVSILGFAITRSVQSGIAVMVTMIDQVAAHNLACPDAEVRSQDEIGKAALALNAMKSNLHALVQSIAETAGHLAGASEELSSSATLQAQSADLQRDQTSQFAAAMQEMSSTAAEVSENSSKAAKASGKAAETARRGGGMVEDTLSKMRAIARSVGSTAKQVENLGKSSDQIGRIIGVIDDIADPTNLLALNAAIEAARAGEQGRGFAVVADEVHRLAERTTTATREIAQMIGTIQEETKSAVGAMEMGTRQVEEGVKTTAEAGDSLREIIRMSDNVGGMITQIATAATEQSGASEEISRNIEQIAKLVRESAAGAQESAKACQDLSSFALDLQKMVSKFRLAEDAQDSPGPAKRPRALGGFRWMKTLKT
jgi:methyl-accepting chemotaxis protein